MHCIWKVEMYTYLRVVVAGCEPRGILDLLRGELGVGGGAAAEPGDQGGELVQVGREASQLALTTGMDVFE